MPGRIRRRCVRHGHQWWDEVHLPFQFCTRWFCDGERVNPDYPMPDEVRAMMNDFLIHKMKLREELRNEHRHSQEG